jgi:hypothetical protein
MVSGARKLLIGSNDRPHNKRQEEEEAGVKDIEIIGL